MQNMYQPIERQIHILTKLIDECDQQQLIDFFNTLHEADAAELVELLSPPYRKKLITVIGEYFNPVILTYTNDAVKESLIDCLAEHQLITVLSKLNESDALELLEEFTQEQRRSLLRTLRPELRIALEESLAYPDDTAGRIMQNEFIALPENMLALQAAAFLHNISYNTSTIFLVNEQRELVAEVSFANLLLAQPEQSLKSIASEIVATVHVHDSQSKVVLIFKKYFISHLAVVDKFNKLVGIIQLHKIVDLIYYQAEENLLQTAGVDDSDFYKSIWSSINSRIRWIMVASLYAIVSAWIMSVFQDVIAKHSIIPALNQILLASIGAAGMQSATITTRALAEKDLIQLNTLRSIRKEAFIGIVNGIILAFVIGLILIFGIANALISVVFAIAIFLSTITVTLAGVLIPIMLAKFKIDPSIGTSALLASFADASGLLIVLTLARYLL